jgi:hypothetical protein
MKLILYQTTIAISEISLPDRAGALRLRRSEETNLHWNQILSIPLGLSPPPLGKKFGERNFFWAWYKMKVKHTD